MGAAAASNSKARHAARVGVAATVVITPIVALNDHRRRTEQATIAGYELACNHMRRGLI